jgi:hypothetical protein
MTQSISGAVNPPVPGFTRFTGFGVIGGVPGPAKPSGIILQDADGYDYYLWVDTTGDLRITDAATAEAAAFNWLSGGTVVGAQS